MTRTRLDPRRWFALFRHLLAIVPISFDHNDRGGDTDGRTGFASTYPEVHNIGWGLAHGLVLGLSFGLTRTATVIATATVVRTLLYAHTGREITILGKAVELPAKYLSQLRRDPHYFDGSVAVGLVLGLAVVVGRGLDLWIGSAGVIA